MTGYMRADERAVPGEAAQLDAYGNMSRRQINKILSQLRTSVVQGDFSGATNSKRSQAKRATLQYFVSQGPGSKRHGFAGKARGDLFGQHLPRGVWERRVHAWGTSVRPILLFVKGTVYTKRYDFFGVAERVIGRRLTANVELAVGQAMASAGFKR